MTANNPDNVGGLPELPELPEPRLRPYKQLDTVYYNAGQMKEYARAYGELCRAAPAGGVMATGGHLMDEARKRMATREGDGEDYESLVAAMRKGHEVLTSEKMPVSAELMKQGADAIDLLRTLSRVAVQEGE